MKGPVATGPGDLFLQTDPIGYDEGLNWYAYVGNDPLNNIDPTGLVAKRAGEESDDPCAGDFDFGAGIVCFGSGGSGGGGGGDGGNATKYRFVENGVTVTVSKAELLEWFAKQNGCTYNTTTESITLYRGGKFKVRDRDIGID